MSALLAARSGRLHRARLSLPGFAYETTVDNLSPVAAWGLGQNLNDRIGSNHGTIGAGSESYTSPLMKDSRGAFNCAGENWISVSHAAALKPAVGWVLCWFKANSVDDWWPISAELTGTNAGDFLLRLFADGRIGVFFTDASTAYSVETDVVYYGVDQVVCSLVRFGSWGFSLELDGNLIGVNENYTDGLTNNTNDWSFGTFAGDNNFIFDGVVDEIAIGNAALNLNERAQLAQIEGPS